MPKPKNKEELIQLSQHNFNQLFGLMKDLPKEKLESNFMTKGLNKNIRDVLVHLHEWHLLLLSWYKVGMKGSKPDMPAKGYTWQTLPMLNKKIWQDSQSVSFSKAKKDLKSSFKKVQKIISTHTDEELFTKKKYSWTGSTSLGAYLILNTSSHYGWAIKLIKNATK